MRVLLALGGNAMTAPTAAPPRPRRSRRSRVAMRAAARLVAAGHELVITHGNGPQVGNLLVKNELAAARRPAGAAGLVRRADAGHARLHHPRRPRRRPRRAGCRAPGRRPRHPHARRPRRPGLHATRRKPIGRYLPREQAQPLIDHGQVWEDRGEKGWRRVVASPEPLEVLDVGPVRALARGRSRRRRGRWRRHPRRA